ncbi:hypothetical protein [Fibrobacter sp. UWR2]|uniref:hypothetical protein n=1 Tax=Fibrobacter sp. UWR2 TaxID=1964352 RepID=UPI000B522068|nr:hypothetical protein [Fibrobacter sp. UWR2]OWV00619.1 hypothetical protein B7994_06030 [Fibrobacter sp. UWR2]
MKKFLLLIPVALAAWFCSSPTNEYPLDLVGGPGSETTNGLALVDGRPASYATVALRKADSRADKAVEENAIVVADTYADEQGRFDVKIPADGKYRLTVAHDGVAFTKIVSRSDFAEPGKATAPDTVNLVATGLVAGVVDVPEGSSTVWVGVLGTDVLVKTDANGWFALPAVPAKDSLQLYFVDETYKTNLGEQTLYVEPMESVLKDYRAPDDGKVVVLQEDGTPAAYATVALRAAGAMVEKYAVQNKMVDSDIRTDDQGKFAMEWPTKGDFRLTVVSEGFAFSKVFAAAELPALDTLRLVPTAAVSSKVTLLSSNDFAWVGVYGLDLLVKTNNVGEYVLPGVPAGDSLSIYFVTADSAKEELYAEWKTAAEPNSTQFLSPVMVLQDFEGDADGWYLNIDSLKKGTEFKTANVVAGIENDSSRGSNVFHGKYKLANDDYAWALIGTSFEHYMNFAAIDSIVFYAKGDGSIRLSLENWVSPTINLKAATDWISLSSKWKRVSVNPAELCVGSANEETCFATWSAVKGGVKQFHIFVEGGSEFYVDDVTLYGALF